MFTTDKIGHGYLPTYTQLLAQLVERGGIPRIVEVGIANGEGLQMFRTLCPHADLYGVDNRPTTATSAGAVAAGAIIVIGDQADPALADQLPGTFDLIVDDASHDNNLTWRTWTNLWPKVSAGGTYVIEDWNHAGGLCEQLARDLLLVFREDAPGVFEGLNRRMVDSITYRAGLIVIRRAL